MKKIIISVLFSSSLSMSAFALDCGLPVRQADPGWSSAKFYSQEIEPGGSREIEVVKQIRLGNVPDFLRHFEVLNIPARYQGDNVVLQLDVAPDYLAIGTDDDFVRAPLTNYAAQTIAGELGFVLPTTFIVDKIYDQAHTQLRPQPTDWYKNSETMRLGTNYLIFNASIESQRQGRGGLVAGHKKDVVLTNRLDSKPGKVAIYGWQEPGNHPIQPLALPHDYYYEDYSHGIRFLGPQLRIVSSAGHVTTRSLLQALHDAELGPLLNDGEPLNDVRAARRCSADFAQAMGVAMENCPPQPRLCP